MGLTVKGIAKLTTRGRYLDERGLYLQVLSPTNRSWLLRFELQGRERWMGLGPIADFTLEEARERARKARQLLADGIDPLAQKHAQKRQDAVVAAKERNGRITFKAAAEAFFAAHEKKWKNDKHRDQFLSSLTLHAFPAIGHLGVGDIDKELVLSVLNPIWQIKPETANRVRSRIETVLNYAGAQGWRDENLPNPARWRGFLDQLFLAKTHVRKVVHFRALPFVDLPQFMPALRKRSGVAARALEFLILTAARTSEVTGAQWEEFDLDEAVWTVPAARMKAGRDHRVPLTAQALALLRALPTEDGNPFVFIGPRNDGLSNMAMDAILRRMDLKDRATVHGFRSTFRDWASETTNFPPDVAEAALAHITGDKVERSYKRGDLLLKRRKMMEAWAAFAEKAPAVVTALHQKANKISL